MKKIVVIGGGTGTFTVLSGLRQYPFELSAIVSTADDGGSTGILRDELGVLPPGDIRQALVALAADSTVLRDLLNYRFTDGTLKGHNFGNLLLSALEKVTGSFDKGVLEASRILAVKGRVIPVTTDLTHLRAEMTNGKVIHGEHKIEEYVWSEASNVKRLWLEPACSLHPDAQQAIRQADLIVIAPGSVFTSLIPNLLVKGMSEALQKSRAKVVYVVNLMTEKGQTGSYFVQDFVDLIEEYMGGRRVDYVLYNTRLPDQQLLDRYKKEMERIPVRFDKTRKARSMPYRMIGLNLLARQLSGQRNAADPLMGQRTLIRHNPARLADVLYSLLFVKDAEKYLR
ncbi:YvcK family protein [Patescibacteria group bacterium]|nr:YvcK family protein [Patescibacteria group bacterium]